MDVSRCVGIGVVMIVPSFVGGGAMWEFFKSWAAVFAWLSVMAITYGFILYKVRHSKHVKTGDSVNV